MRQTAQPNFFIVGAPKCGTTALYSYLSEHDQIYMPWIKEPHYFAAELEKSRVRPIDNLTEYCNLFHDCGPKHTIAGEASVFYLASPCALQKIYEFNDHAKIIVMVRNPIDMFASLHSQLYSTLDENQKDPEQAWRLQSVRSTGKKIPPTCRIPGILQYQKTCSLGKQVQMVLNIFPEHQVKIILFDDFIENTYRLYKEILTFLGVKYDGRIHFPAVNENKVIRFRSFASMYHDRGFLGPFWSLLERLRSKRGISYNSCLHPLYTIAHKLYMRVNTKPATRSLFRTEFRRELKETFQEDIHILSQVINKNLGHWLADLRQ